MKNCPKLSFSRYGIHGNSFVVECSIPKILLLVSFSALNFASPVLQNSFSSQAFSLSLFFVGPYLNVVHNNVKLEVALLSCIFFSDAD